MAPLTKQRLLTQKRPKIIDLAYDVLTTANSLLSFGEVVQRVRTLAGRKVPRNTVRVSLIRLRSRGKPVYMVGEHPHCRYTVEKQPRIIDLTYNALLTSDTPLTFNELTERVSSMAGYSVSRETIQVMLTRLRSWGASAPNA